MSEGKRTRAALEAALVAEPDDLATHHAYADLLTEQGDPRGEFIHVQLALEDAGRTTDERQQLRRRERELLDAHEREWLGELAPLLLGTHDERWLLLGMELSQETEERNDWTEHLDFTHSWYRGWLDRFECSLLSFKAVRQLGRHPLARLMRFLTVRQGYGTWNFNPAGRPDPGDVGYTFQILSNYPILANIRRFQYGAEDDPDEDRYECGRQYDGLFPLVEQMPRLEELHVFGHLHDHDDMWRDNHDTLSLSTLANLRVYRHHHGTTYALEALAANPALGRLTDLLVYPHAYARYLDPDHPETHGDFAEDYWPALRRENVSLIFTSPHLKSLRNLQLRCCSGGDGMIDDMVTSGILKRLKTLDLRHGHVSDAGARTLAACSDARNLEALDLVNNRLTAEGITVLQRVGIPVRAERQQEPPFHDDSILYYGDSE
jgi:uncharacterized protein (TIGR02996 family)